MGITCTKPSLSISDNEFCQPTPVLPYLTCLPTLSRPIVCRYKWGVVIYFNCFLNHTAQTQNSYTRTHTRPYENTHTPYISMTTSERLSRQSRKIDKVTTDTLLSTDASPTTERITLIKSWNKSRKIRAQVLSWGLCTLMGLFQHKEPCQLIACSTYLPFIGLTLVFSCPANANGISLHSPSSLPSLLVIRFVLHSKSLC